MDEQTVLDRLIAQLRPMLIERWYGGDPYGYIELCTDDVTLFAPGTNGRLAGRAAMRKMYAAAEGKIVVPHVEIVDPKIRVFDDSALLTYTVREFAKGDPAPSGRWDTTELYRRVGDDWRIVHAHWSVTQ